MLLAGIASAQLPNVLVVTGGHDLNPLAWVRTEGDSRGVYIQTGHGPQVLDHLAYRRLLAQAIRWAARR